MFSAFERLVASRYLRARRKEGFISVIAGFSLVGIALGVATLIIVMAVMNGFREELVNRIVGLSGHVNVYAYNGGITDFDAVAARIEALPQVQEVVPTVESQALMTVEGRASGALVRGVRPEDWVARPAIAENLNPPGGVGFAGPDVVAIGIGMARSFDLGVGDSVSLVAPQGSATAFGTVPRMRAYRIAAIFDVGMFEYDSSFVYMPLESAQVLFRLPGQVTTLEVFTADPEAGLDQVAAAITEAAGPGLWTRTWQQANEGFFTALRVERNVMFLILTLIILVAALNVISGLVMLVKDKGRDIAILRTMGATRGMILRVFFLTGASIGVVGTLAGLGLGIAFAANIETVRQWLQRATGTVIFDPMVYFLAQLPARVDWVEVGAVVAMSLALSFLATIYPAWRAARLDPVEALRYE